LFWEPTPPIKHRSYPRRSVSTAAICCATSSEPVAPQIGAADVVSITSFFETCITLVRAPPGYAAFDPNNDELRRMWKTSGDFAVARGCSFRCTPTRGASIARPLQKVCALKGSWPMGDLP